MTFQASIPLDDDGFLDRQCHSDNCGRYFKVLYSDWEAAEINAAICPFCGFLDEPGNFTTVDQQHFLQENALALGQETVQEMLTDFATGVNRRQSRNSLVSINVTTKLSEISLPVTPEALDSMRLRIQCDQRDCTYAVVGAGFFCPLCGANSARHSFQQAIAKARNAVEVAHELGSRHTDRDAAAEAKRDALENQINNLVTAFQRFGEATYADLPRYRTPAGRNLFQRLIEASTKWSEAGGRSFESMLEPRDWSELLKYFQQRHVLSHQDGFVDAEYIKKSGDTTYKAGQRLVITEARVLGMAELVEKLGLEMQADLPERKANQVYAPVVAARPVFPPKLPGVTDEDWRVYRLICESAVEQDWDNLDDAAVWQAAQQIDIGEEDFGDAIQVLDSKGLVSAAYVLDRSRVPRHIRLTLRGSEIYLRHVTPNYALVLQNVAKAIVDGETSSDEIKESLGLSKLLALYVIKDFERRGWLTTFWAGTMIITKYAVELKRFAHGGLHT